MKLKIKSFSLGIFMVFSLSVMSACNDPKDAPHAESNHPPASVIASILGTWEVTSVERTDGSGLRSNQDPGRHIYHFTSETQGLYQITEQLSSEDVSRYPFPQGTTSVSIYYPLNLSMHSAEEISAVMIATPTQCTNQLGIVFPCPPLSAQMRGFTARALLSPDQNTLRLSGTIQGVSMGLADPSGAQNQLTYTLRRVVSNVQPQSQAPDLSESEEPVARVTRTSTRSTGEVIATFTQVTDHPELGEEVWQLGHIIWGDVVKRPDTVFGGLEAHPMTAQEAGAYCASIGARLPNILDIRNLVRALGGVFDRANSDVSSIDSEDPTIRIIEELPIGYQPQILPGINDDFWIASPFRGGYAKFAGTTGRILLRDMESPTFRTAAYFVRCVLSVSATRRN